MIAEVLNNKTTFCTHNLIIYLIKVLYEKLPTGWNIYLLVNDQQMRCNQALCKLPLKYFYQRETFWAIWHCVSIQEPTLVLNYSGVNEGKKRVEMSVVHYFCSSPGLSCCMEV